MIKILPRLSPSKIKLFQKCPQLYEYKYNHHLDDDANIWAIWGTSLHKAIEMKYVADEHPYIAFQNKMQERMDFYGSKKIKIAGEDLYAKHLKLGREIIDQINWDLMDLCPDTKPEQFFELPFPSKEDPICIMVGIIDFIDRRDYIIDHKSASEKPEANVLANDPQFLIYRWAYNQLFDNYPGAIYWHHLRNVTFYEAKVDIDYEFKIGRLIDDIKAMLTTTKFHRKEQDVKFCGGLCSFYELCYGKKL